MFISRILVPIDFSTRSTPALRYALGIARTCGAQVTLLHVVPAPSLSEVETMGGARAQMNALLACNPPEQVAVESCIEVGSPSHTIGRFAKEGDYDLIVLGTRARIGLAELVLGSVAHELMAGAPCPIVTLREQPRAAA